VESLSYILTWSGYDQRPITLELYSWDPLGPIPFLFNPHWAQDSLFFYLMVASQSCWIQDFLVHIWQQKLKLTKQSLRD
jgi:hypothetical protein